MKKLLLLFVAFILTLEIIAQDAIFKMNGEEIQAKVLEITENSIKYKEYKFQEGPIRNINKSDVFMIMYENGKREKFTSSEVQKINNEYIGEYFMIGFGVGSSYGGIGIRLQSRFKEVQGFGIHGGVGFGDVSFNKPMFWSIGFKYFPYKDFYINTQFGVTGTEYIYEQISFSDETSNHEARHGPSVLIGGDWNWGNKVGIGFNFGIGFSYTMNNEMGYSGDFKGAIDLGFIVRI